MPVPAEDLIKYGHRISASNAVSAPLTWQQGDPRRPYPTDIEMRLGFLARPESAIVAEQQGRIIQCRRGLSCVTVICEYIFHPKLGLLLNELKLRYH